MEEENGTPYAVIMVGRHFRARGKYWKVKEESGHGQWQCEAVDGSKYSFLKAEIQIAIRLCLACGGTAKNAHYPAAGVNARIEQNPDDIDKQIERFVGTTVPHSKKGRCFARFATDGKNVTNLPIIGNRIDDPYDGGIGGIKPEVGPTPSPDDIFEQAEEFAGATEPPSNEVIAKLATDMTVLNDWCKTAEAKLKAKQKEVEAMKLQLYEQLIATNHTKGWKFDNGINIAPKETETVFKASGVNDDKVLGWLFSNDLGDLIKTTTHWKSLSNAVLVWLESNRQEDGSAIPLPEIFNLQVKKTVHFRGNGASQFLKKYHEEQENENSESHN